MSNTIDVTRNLNKYFEFIRELDAAGIDQANSCIIGALSNVVSYEEFDRALKIAEDRLINTGKLPRTIGN